MNLRPRFWTRMDEDRRRTIKFVAGLFLAVFTVFSILSVLSYFTTWKADASLATATGEALEDYPVHNMAGKIGWRWSHFLVGSCFGLGAIGILVALVVACIKLFVRKRIHLSKAFTLSVTAAFLASVILAYAASFGAADNAFGGGLGGRFGAALVSAGHAFLGKIVTGVLIGALALVWLYFLSSRFASWILGHSSDDEEEEQEQKQVEVKPVIQKPVIVIPKPEEVKKPEPVKPVEVPEEEEDTPEEEVEPGLEVITDDTLDEKVRKELPRINNRDELPGYKFPSLDILHDYASSRQDVSTEELSRNNNKIRATLKNYKIEVVDVKAVVGPTVTLYKVFPAPGVKIAAIKSLQEDIAMSLNARGVRVVALSDCVGIEVANDVPSIVPLKALMNDEAFRESKAELPVAIGYTITQKVKVFDLADAPHLLVAGATKQGKSVGLNVIVSSLLYAKHPSELKFVFIDPKMVEFSAYAKLLYHYLAVLPRAASAEEELSQAIVKNPKAAKDILSSLCTEMDSRYELLSKAEVNNIKRYNDKFRDRHLLPTEGHRFLPYLVVVIDEYADLTMSVGAGGEAKAMAKSITTSVIRLAQKGRAAGIHVILATQRPTVDVVTGLIKTNFPMRIAFRVTSRIDSMTILDTPGADKLIGKGDMLLYNGIETERVQCALIGGDEIQDLTEAVASQSGYKKSYNTPYYLPEPPSEEGSGGEGEMVDMKQLDERFEEAARLVVQYQKGSTSDLQRRLGMGYAKAGRVMDQLQAAGIVGPQDGSKPRQVLVSDFAELDRILESFKG